MFETNQKEKKKKRKTFQKHIFSIISAFEFFLSTAYISKPFSLFHKFINFSTLYGSYILCRACRLSFNNVTAYRFIPEVEIV
jgi:hypothetical protein